jgi:hypothetical protein
LFDGQESLSIRTIHKNKEKRLAKSGSRFRLQHGEMNLYPDQAGFVMRGALRGNGFNFMAQIIPEFL